MNDRVGEAISKYHKQVNERYDMINKALADGCGADCPIYENIPEVVVPQNDFPAKDVETNGLPWPWIILGLAILTIGIIWWKKRNNTRT